MLLERFFARGWALVFVLILGSATMIEVAFIPADPATRICAAVLSIINMGIAISLLRKMPKTDDKERSK